MFNLGINKTKKDELKNFLLNNTDELMGVVSNLNSWNGCLDYLEAYHNDEEFFSVFFEDKPMEAVRATHFGKYNYNDDYVRFNGYGNLETISEYEYEEELKDSIDDIMDNLIDYSQYVYLSDEAQEIFDEI